MRRSFVVIVGLLIIVALLAGAGLLLSDLLPSFVVVVIPHVPISAAPLLLIGVASLGFQALTRPRLLDVCRALLLSLAFVLWGIDQMLPRGWQATTLGDVVIVLYVIDLAWMMGAALLHQKNPSSKKL